jgi:hypothetical protein
VARSTPSGKSAHSLERASRSRDRDHRHLCHRHRIQRAIVGAAIHSRESCCTDIQLRTGIRNGCLVLVAARAPWAPRDRGVRTDLGRSTARRIDAATPDGYSPSMSRWMDRALPVLSSQSITTAHILGSPLAASNFPGMPVRNRPNTKSFSIPMTLS